MSQHTELIARLRAESDELIKYQFSHTKEAMSCLQRLHDLSLEAADALQALERVPMTEADLYSIESKSYVSTRVPYWEVNGFTGEEEMKFRAEERFSFLKFGRNIEAHHGITPPESKE